MTFALSYLYLLSFVGSLVITILMAVLMPRHAYKVPLVIGGVASSVWSLTDFLSNLAISGEHAYNLHMVAAPFWASLPFCFLHAALLYSGRVKRLASTLLEAALALPAAVVVAVEWSGLLYTNFRPATPEVPWFYCDVSPIETFVMLYSLTYLAGTGWLLTTMSAGTTEEQLRSNRHLFLYYLVPLAIVALLSNGGVALLGAHPPQIASITISLAFMLVGVGALRNSFFHPLARMLVNLDQREEVLAAMPFAVGILPIGEPVLRYASPRLIALVPAEATDELLEACIFACMKDPDTAYEFELDNFPRLGRAIHVRGTPILYAGEPARLVVVSDASAQVAIRQELVKNREQLAEARKLEYIGRLSATIVHDFNNLLGVIQTGTHTARMVALDPDVQAALDDVFQAVDVGRSLNHKLLRHSREESPYEATVVDLNALVNELRPLIEGAVGNNVTLEVQSSATPAFVQVDKVFFGQVLVNLARNANDAMPQGGQLTFRVCAECSAAHAELLVEDNGLGMSPDVLARAMDPYFSTKGASGNGVGLASVRETVEKSGGTVTIQSTVGKGTAFTLRLPQVRAPATVGELVGTAG